MKAACKEALRQGGCVSSVCGVSRLIFHAVVCWARPRQSYSWPPFPGRELVARGPQAGFLLSLPVNCHQTSESLHDVSQRQTKSPIGTEPPTCVLPRSNSSVTARAANGDVSAKIQLLQYSKQLAAISCVCFLMDSVRECAASALTNNSKSAGNIGIICQQICKCETFLPKGTQTVYSHVSDSVQLYLFHSGILSSVLRLAW